MPDLADLCAAAVEAAEADEQVEAYGEESQRIHVRARDGDVESLSFADTRGIGIRVIASDRVGYAYAADPASQDVVGLVGSARASARLSEPDEGNLLPTLEPVEPLPGIYRKEQAAVETARKVALALELERAAVSSNPDVKKVESASYGDSNARVVLMSTQGGPLEYSRSDCWVSVSSLAEREAETQTGFGFRLARDVAGLDWEAAAAEAADRAARLLGGTKPRTDRTPVVLDPVASVSFLGVLASALSAESVQKGRSPLAGMVDSRVAGDAIRIVDDGRLLEGPAAAPFDDEGVATTRTPLIDQGTVRGFLHNTYTAARAADRSTGNARRASYRTAPGVSPSNLYLEQGEFSIEALLAKAARGVYVQEVSGLHSGANPVSGEFSVGAVGVRIEDGAFGRPLREMTIASTLLELLSGIVAVGSDLRFFPHGGGFGAPTVLVNEMTVGGI